MKISLFLNNDLESNIALNCLLPNLSNHQFNIYLSERVGNLSSVKPLQHLEFLEKEFPNKYLFPELKLSTSGFLSFDQIAGKYQVPLTQVSSINDTATLENISRFNPDLFLSIRFGKIFKGQVLSIPRLGIINLHSALLPDYKGVLGTFRAILNGEIRIGSTIHYITDNGIDTGRIIQLNENEVTPGKSVLWHILNLYPPAIIELNKIINKVASDEPIHSVYQPDIGNYYTFPLPEDFEKLRNSNVELYNSNEYADLINHYYHVDQAWVKNILALNKIPEIC